MEAITVGLWATNIEPPAASPAAWVALVETRMAEAQAAGAEQRHHVGAAVAEGR